MSKYYLILIWVFISFFLVQALAVERTEIVCGEKVRRLKPHWAFLIFFPLIIWSGYRGYVGDSPLSSMGQKNMRGEWH